MSPSDRWTAVGSLLRDEAAAALKWRVLLRSDLRRAEMIADAAFDDLSEKGRSEATAAGLAPGGTVRIQVRAELDGRPMVRLLAKDAAIMVRWISRQAESSTKAEAEKKGECFVATAAFGSPLASEIGILRHLRDAHLRHTVAGARFIGWYEVSGPRLAKRRRTIPRAAPSRASS